uniref:alpha-1,2-Mannosidase n=1 Tax=Tetraselmis sp. GSL018 TaxID=582737 RepID=A0A061RG39_9CHLO
MPIYLNPSTGEFSTKQVSLGAMGDSYYEYLLKVWILFGKNDESYRAMWEQAMDEMLERLIHKTTPSGFTYVAELSRSGALVHKMDHLACFVPGMLALGVHHKAVQGAKAERYLEVAKGLTETCYQMYRRMPSGIAPEYIEIKNGQDFVTNPKASFNLQRPEAVEAFFVLYRVTGDPKYQEYGWEVFSAFETFTRVDAGYTGVKDVTKLPLARDDTMQSFWLAETLKYLYLLFSPRSTISLDEWVMNTEAHPMKIRPWKFNN